MTRTFRTIARLRAVGQGPATVTRALGGSKRMLNVGIRTPVVPVVEAVQDLYPKTQTEFHEMAFKLGYEVRHAPHVSPDCYRAINEEGAICGSWANGDPAFNYLLVK